MNKKTARLRRAVKTRMRIKSEGLSRLCVFRTPRHIYAQVIAAGGSEVLVSASSLDKEVRSKIKNGGNKEAARGSRPGGCRTGKESRDNNGCL